MESVFRKENSRRWEREKVRPVSDEETVVSVPAIAVVERVHVRVPIALVAIDVANRDASCDTPSITPFQAGHCPSSTLETVSNLGS